MYKTVLPVFSYLFIFNWTTFYQGTANICFDGQKIFLFRLSVHIILDCGQQRTKGNVFVLKSLIFSAKKKK